MANTKRTSAKEWAKRVQRWERSGLTATEFGAREGYDGKRLTWWKWHLGLERAASSKPAARTEDFVPVRVVHSAGGASPAPLASRHSAGCVEIQLANGRVVRAIGSVEGSLLALAIQAAEGG
jgi:hypothetical protein